MKSIPLRIMVRIPFNTFTILLGKRFIHQRDLSSGIAWQHVFLIAPEFPACSSTPMHARSLVCPEALWVDFNSFNFFFEVFAFPHLFNAWSTLILKIILFFTHRGLPVAFYANPRGTILCLQYFFSWSYFRGFEAFQQLFWSFRVPTLVSRVVQLNFE